MRTSEDFKHYLGNDLESMANATNYYNWLIDEFGPHIKGNVAEVGVGTGTFSKYILRRKPKRFFGIEPSEEMFPLVKKNLKRYKNVSLYNNFLNQIDDDLTNELDTIFYINVLEHVEKDEEELVTIHKLLKPGGRLCIYVPAIQALLGSFDKQVGHYRRYSTRDLRSKLCNAGFEIERLHYSDMLGIIPWIISFKILKRKVLSNKSVLVYDKFIIPIIKFQERFIKPPVGKNIWAVAVKKA